ncbi:hypothetical protein COMA2_20162 [Candidatus Nitrospira nitrificans]|uniref:Uncharacterized protein n=1 Tax=Candidatus Nitrospira nitrificans TaxID=1742973 RepID=A0A0S4LF80_9BACT|nr:hypothetical protein COMA2_20162 [Candidatus Nitrospira nitrificans]
MAYQPAHSVGDSHRAYHLGAHHLHADRERDLRNQPLASLDLRTTRVRGVGTLVGGGGPEVHRKPSQADVDLAETNYRDAAANVELNPIEALRYE